MIIPEKNTTFTLTKLADLMTLTVSYFAEQSKCINFIFHINTAEAVNESDLHGAIK